MSGEINNIAEDVAKKMKKGGFDDVVVKITYLEETMTKAANNTITITQNWSNKRLDLYLAKDKRISVMSTHFSSFEDIEKILDSSSNVISKIQPSELYAELPKPNAEHSSKILDIKVIEKMSEVPVYMQKMIEKSLESGAEKVAGVLSFIKEEKVLSINGEENFNEVSTAVKTYIRSFKGEKSGMWSFGSRYLDEKELLNTSEKATQFALLQNKKEKIDSGKYDIILSPLIAGNLLNYIMFSASAFNALAGLSFFKNNENNMYSEQLSLYDSPEETDLPGSTKFDDEGLATYTKPIIEKGMFKTFLHNSKTAKKFNTKSTANAGMLAPINWNIKVNTGDSSLEEMIRETKLGIFFNNNWYTRLHNYAEGIFSTAPRDAILLIKDGEIVGYLDRIRIADSFSNLLKKISMLSKDIYKIWWWEVSIPTKVPYIKVDSIRIATESLA
ncbi:MAG: metallopeptidase TldD-related protein [Fervidicoccus sp.]